MNSVSVLPDSILRVVQRWNPSSDPGRLVSGESSSGTRIYVVGPQRCGREDIVQMFRASGECSIAAREADADVVLLVVDAASVIGREDLLLLDDAAESGTPVVVALTALTSTETGRLCTDAMPRFFPLTAPPLPRHRSFRLRLVRSRRSLPS
ncbi:hypothetical protein ACFWAD_21675 [Rhodococcus sp. NPDC059969]|uniref:hypothetical protein n=1 Tax=Rhodococcus sp. NPDC059969 TaxID=3347018 RepID=UPI0036711C61